MIGPYWPLFIPNFVSTKRQTVVQKSILITYDGPSFEAFIFDAIDKAEVTQSG